MGSLVYKKEQEIDFAQLENLENISELIVHYCTIKNFSLITAAKDLKSIAIVGCSITSEDLRCLKELEKLKSITLGLMKLDGISCLAEIASLRDLTLRAVEGVAYAELVQFPKLLRLRILETEIPSFDFMKKLRNLKVLEFQKVPIGNLDFLYDVPRLREFEMRYRADDETALKCVSGMKYLQTFQYPVPDMSVYRGCAKIASIGIDSSRVGGFEALEGMETVTGVMFYNLETKEKFERQLDEVRKYLKLRSYGYMEKVE